MRVALTSDGARLLALLGGWTGLVDGALPPLVLIAVSTGASPYVGRTQALGLAVIGTAATTAGLLALRLRRHHRLRPVVIGTAGTAAAVLFAATAGDMRAYFLPGILVDAVYALAFAGSALAGRPLVKTVHRWLRPDSSSGGHALEQAFTTATVGWSVVFGVRAGTQAALYAADQPALLALSKVVLGWPLTVLAVLITLRFLSWRSASPHLARQSTEDCASAPRELTPSFAKTPRRWNATVRGEIHS